MKVEQHLLKNMPISSQTEQQNTKNNWIISYDFNLTMKLNHFVESYEIVLYRYIRNVCTNKST